MNSGFCVQTYLNVTGAIGSFKSTLIEEHAKFEELESVDLLAFFP